MSVLAGLHGYYKTPVYNLWRDIIKRCEDDKSHNYKYYGGRGIKMCDEWRNNPKLFCEWALENGYAKGLEIDRKNNNGNYEPNNCHFITHKENCAINKRRLNVRNKTGERNICLTKSGTFESYANEGNRKQTFIGTYKNIEYAVIARDAVEKYIKKISGGNNG